MKLTREEVEAVLDAIQDHDHLHLAEYDIEVGLGRVYKGPLEVDQVIEQLKENDVNVIDDEGKQFNG